MGVAHFEAFVTDATKAVYAAKPELMAPDLSLDARTLLGLGSWDAVLKHLASVSARSTRRGSLLDRVERLAARLGIEPIATSDEAATLRRLIQARHAIVHGGGRVTREYVEQSCEGGIAIGDSIPLSDELAEEAVGLLRGMSEQADV